MFRVWIWHRRIFTWRNHLTWVIPIEGCLDAGLDLHSRKHHTFKVVWFGAFSRLAFRLLRSRSHGTSTRTGPNAAVRLGSRLRVFFVRQLSFFLLVSLCFHYPRKKTRTDGCFHTPFVAGEVGLFSHSDQSEAAKTLKCQAGSGSGSLKVRT